jgi:catechol 2,3-dioxygenase-like lactoylglutathione lyase family enzyme
VSDEVPAAAYHHLAIRVSDLERSTTFYERVFGGQVAFSMSLTSDFLESMLLSPEGVSGTLNWLTFDGASSLELWQFSSNEPVRVADQTTTAMMHFGLWVDDVAAAVARVESEGGRARIPIRPWREGRHVTFIQDPDGYVIELLDAKQEETVRILAAGGGPPDHERVAGSAGPSQ